MQNDILEAPTRQPAVSPSDAANIVEELIQAVDCGRVRKELSLVGAVRLERAKTLVRELRGEA